MMEVDNDSDTIMNYPKKQSRRSTHIIVEGTIPCNRQDLMDWRGWGYKDSEFVERDGDIVLTGNRYEISNKPLVNLKGYLKEYYDLDVKKDFKPFNNPMPSEDQFPKSRLDNTQLKELKKLNLKMSIKGVDRMFRSHGLHLEEIDQVRRNAMKRIPDVIIWPTCHEDVVEIIKICDKINIVVIPTGGCTNITGSIYTPQNENRTILALDMLLMNEILWVDKENLLICCEAGIVGQDLEREMQKIGYTLGHEPDSIEFSTLGGWVSTKSSGMKKNKYGNIENLVVNATMVTPRGIIQRGNIAPRFSSGLDVNSIIIGSEGSYGVVTEAIIKIFPKPQCQRYGSILFPDFMSGYNFIRKVALLRCQPASIRLMDHEQFKIGLNFRLESSYLTSIIESMKTSYLTMIKGFDMSKVTLVTLVYEGENEEVTQHQKRINGLAKEYGGIDCGENVGKRGYFMTYSIVYTRDMAYDYNVIAESMECAVPWDRALTVLEEVKNTVNRECRSYGSKHCLLLARIAQTYDSGCCIYFYYTFTADNVKEPLKSMEHLETAIRDSIMDNGGCLSHHHGVGKWRKKWFSREVSPLGVNLYRVLKNYLDPNNIFATENFTDSLKIEQCKL